MKIIEDPISGSPAHGLSKEEVAILWTLLPTEWTSSVFMARLCNQVNTPLRAEYSSVSKRLTVFGRNRKRVDVIRAILAEMHSRFSGCYSVGYGRLSSEQQKRVAADISPLVTRVTEEIRRTEQAMDGNPH